MNTESKKITFSFFFSLGLILVSFIVGQPDPPLAAEQIQAPGQRQIDPAGTLFLDKRLNIADEPIDLDLPQTNKDVPALESPAYAFHNPAGCAPSQGAWISKIGISTMSGMGQLDPL